MIFLQTRLLYVIKKKKKKEGAEARHKQFSWQVVKSKISSFLVPLNFPFKNPLKNSDGIKRTGQNFHTVKQRSQDHTGKHDRDMCLSSEVPRQTKCTPTDFALRFLANTRLPLQSLRVGFFPFQRKTLKRTSPKLWVISVQKNNNN